MSAALKVLRAGPGVTVQDLGRPGYMALGLSRGGAADRLAIFEGAALLTQAPDLAALELTGAGAEFEATEPMRIALTGAEMRAALDGAPLVWNASHRMMPGQLLILGPVLKGTYGYLHIGGGIATAPFLGSRATHVAAGLGPIIQAGTVLPIGQDKEGNVGHVLPRDPRFEGGTVAIVRGPQTALFSDAELARFEGMLFTRDARANRMGVRMNPDGQGFDSAAGLSVVSDVIVPGDVQITGDGAPYVLLSECQTTGGYPRIGAVLPSDLPRVAQTPLGATLRFRFVDHDTALAQERKSAAAWADLRRAVRPLVRDPRDIPDLLRYQLISGVVSGQEED